MLVSCGDEFTDSELELEYNKYCVEYLDLVNLACTIEELSD
jgi:hypothetical protein